MKKALAFFLLIVTTAKQHLLSFVVVSCLNAALMELSFPKVILGKVSATNRVLNIHHAK